MAIRYNKCLNPSAESGTSNTQPYTGSSAPALATTTERSTSGAQAFRVTYGGTATANRIGIATINMSGMPAGTVVTASFDVYVPTSIAPNITSGRIFFRDDVAATTFAIVTPTTVAPVKGQWARLYATTTVPSGNQLTSVYCDVSFDAAPASTATVDFDSILVEPGNSEPGSYFEGTYVSPETLQGAMNRLAGTKGLDAQGAAQIWANSVVPPSSSLAGSPGWTGNSAVTLTDNGDHLRGTLTSATVALLAQNVRVVDAPAVAGRTYTAVAQGRTTTSAAMQMALEFRDAGSVSIGSATLGADTVVNSSTFTHLSSITVVAPANTEKVVFYVALASTGARAIGNTFDVRRAVLMDGTDGGRELDLVGALNYRNESTGVELAGVLNQLAETQGLDVDGAASRIVA